MFPFLYGSQSLHGLDRIAEPLHGVSNAHVGEEPQMGIIQYAFRFVFPVSPEHEPLQRSEVPDVGNGADDAA